MEIINSQWREKVLKPCKVIGNRFNKHAHTHTQLHITFTYIYKLQSHIVHIYTFYQYL